MNNMTQTWLMVNNTKLEAKSMPDVTRALEALDEGKASALMGVQIKSPILGLVLTLFLGQLGVGRFYSGSTGRGLVCLLLWVVGIGGWVACTCMGMREGALAAICLGPAAWMMLLDLFCIMGEIKRENTKRLFVALGMPVESGLKKRMREHIIVYWILLAVLGGSASYGVFAMSEEIAAKESMRQEAIRQCERFAAEAAETTEKLRKIQNDGF